VVSPSPTWPAAVSALSVATLAAPVREGTVLGAFRHAVYLAVDDGDVLPLVAAGGLRLPTALWLARPAPVGWGVQPGDRVLVGAGEVRLPAVTVRAVRVWTPDVVPVAAGGTELALPGRASPLRQVAHELAKAAAAGDDVRDDVRALVGAGPGLTPSGDDVLCGVLLGLRLRGCAEAVERVWSEVAARLTTTTLLSAALLRGAADGYAVPAVVGLATALADGNHGEVERRVAEVLAIGHTSGSDLLAGLAGALDAAAQLSVRAGGPARLGAAR
jgi:Protein of unknown function (DUF2877)